MNVNIGAWVCTTLTALLLLAPMAQAKDNEKIVVLKTETEDGKPSDVAALENAITEELKAREGYTILPTPEADVLDLAFDAECMDTDVECFTAIGKNLGADYVVFASLAGGNANIQVIDVNKGEEKSAFVAAASGGFIAGVVAGSAASFGPKPAPTPPPVVAKPKPKPKPKPKVEAKKPEAKPVKVSITTVPEGAFIYINNKRVGKSPVQLEQIPGVYTLRVLKPGFAESLRELKVSKAPVNVNIRLSEEGGNTALAVVVPVSTGAPGADSGEPEFYETWWFWTSVGVGVALLSVGVAAGAGAFDSTETSTGDLNFIFESGAEKDFRVQGLRR